MPTLLQLDSSPLPTSVSRELTQEFAKTWTAAHPGGVVIHRDLAAAAPQPLDAAWIFSSFTSADVRTAEQHAALQLSDTLIAELEKADEYVIGVAMHNFSIPSTLKLWIDQVLRAGCTFSYCAAGAQGLLKGKKATLVIASGGVYEPGSPLATYNFVEPYLKTVLSFIGVTDITVVAAGGTAKLRSPEVDRNEFLKPALEQVRNCAA
jgi:FMN-dependent NADH-azoreductase